MHNAQFTMHNDTMCVDFFKQIDKETIRKVTSQTFRVVFLSKREKAIAVNAHVFMSRTKGFVIPIPNSKFRIPLTTYAIKTTTYAKGIAKERKNKLK